MKNDKDRVKLHFSRSNLFIMSGFFVLCIAFLWAMNLVPDEKRYIRQLFGFFSLASFALAVFFLCKLFTREIRFELYRRIGRVFSTVSLKVKKAVDKVLEKLGISTISKTNRRDERDIIYDYGNDRRRRARTKYTPKKYAQTTDNRERIRFIWSKYIIQHTTKENTPRVYDTPHEMMKRFSKLEDESDISLYDSYLSARYTSPEYIPDDETVVKHYKFVSNGKKL